MSTQTKTTQNTNQSNDVFAIYKQNVQKYFDGITKNTPQYFQAFENMVNFSIVLQKEFVTKENVVSDVPSTALKMINDTTEEFVKMFSIQTQIAFASIDATQQNIQTFNDNIKSFVELNKNILQSWISVFTTKNN